MKTFEGRNWTLGWAAIAGRLVDEAVPGVGAAQVAARAVVDGGPGAGAVGAERCGSKSSGAPPRSPRAARSPQPLGPQPTAPQPSATPTSGPPRPASSPMQIGPVTERTIK
jgi:hypothetical protein